MREDGRRGPPIPWRGFYKVSALQADGDLLFSFWISKRRKATKEEKKPGEGFRTSSRNRRWLGLQVFALTRTVRSSSPHAATAARGPLSPGLHLLKTTTQGPRPLCGEPRGNARTESAAFRTSHPVRAGHPAGPTHYRISRAPSIKRLRFRLH